MQRHALILALCVAAGATAAQDSSKAASPEDQKRILDLIEQNSGTLTRALKRPSAIMEPSQIWIHIRSDTQEPEAEKIADLLREGVHLGPVTRDVDLRPVQKVDIGPSALQVRYFKREDQATAHEIVRTLNGAGVEATSESFVEEFKDSSYIDIGHIEIWLPDSQN